jgi:hypothetical protein
VQIHREKFFALTATLAGFWPNAACVINLGGGTATLGTSDATSTGTETTGGSTQGSTGTGTSAATEASSTAPTTGTPTTGGSTGSSTGGAEGDCCAINDTPGCSDDTIEQCVCDEDPFCCGLEGGNWDDTCVGEVTVLGCGMCDLPDTSTGTSSTG